MGYGGVGGFLVGGEGGPGAGDHVMQDGFLPGEVGVGGEEGGGVEVFSAGVAGAADEGEFGGEVRVHDFTGDGPAGREGLVSPDGLADG